MNEEPKHSPGPWTATEKLLRDGGNLIEIHAANGTRVAGFDPDDFGPEKTANARLISAAPELLEQLVALCVQIEASGMSVPSRTVTVIVKAKGASAF